MAGRGRGRGRGFRVTSSTPMREPDPDTVARLVGSASAGSTVTVDGQFTDVPPQRTGQTSQQQTQQQQQSPQQQQQSPQQQQRSNQQQQHTQEQQRGIAVTSMATNGQLSSPQDLPAGGTSDSQEKSSAKSSTLPSELKAVLKEGTTVVNPLSLEFPSTAYTSAKLNPTAQPFSPVPSALQPSQFNPTPSTTPSLPSASLIVTKNTPSSIQTPQTQNASSSSSLNPNSEEFVPKITTLNIAAPEFVPKIGLPPSMQNGDPSLPGKVDDLDLDLLQLKYNEVEDPVLKPQDIVDGFERIVAEDGDRTSPLLKLVAEILIKGTLYPGSFEMHVIKIEESLQRLPPSQETLQNLAEMIVHWGIGEPGLRYTACRLCQVMCEMKPIADFNKILMARLQVWFSKRKEPVTKTTEEKEAFINFAFFYAEAFARVRLNNSPFHVLGVAIFELVQKLLSVKEDKLVMVGCSILKLTGNLLEECEKKGSSKMEQVVETLKKLAIDDSLSRPTFLSVNDKVASPRSVAATWSDLEVARELQAVKWGKGMKSAPPTSTSTLTPANQQPPLDELIFNPSHPMGAQLPVTDPDDWNEYVDEDDLVVEDTDTPDFLPGDVDSQGMDPDMQDEFEAFIDEIEDHLLMQDFDPDVPYDVPGNP